MMMGGIKWIEINFKRVMESGFDRLLKRVVYVVTICSSSAKDKKTSLMR